MTIIAIVNNKGGILKTTTAIELSAVAVREGKDVLIIDADPQGNSALSFGLNADNCPLSLFNVIFEGTPAKDAVVNAYKIGDEGKIDLLPAKPNMEYFGGKVISNKKAYPEPFLLLREKLQKLTNFYDLVLIDCPPSLGLLTGNCLALADQVIIPFQPEPYAMRSLLKTVKAVEDVQQNFNSEIEIIGVLPTLVVKRARVHKAVLKELKKYSTTNAIPVFDTMITKSVSFATALAYEGKPAGLGRTTRNDKAVLLYKNLYTEVMKYGKQRAGR